MTLDGNEENSWIPVAGPWITELEVEYVSNAVRSMQPAAPRKN